MKSKFATPLKITVALSMLAATSIILGKYLAFGIGEVLRFSFENLPIIFAGCAFGPIAGLAVGVCADLIGCVLVGYAINPWVTVGAAVIGLVSGAVFAIVRRLGMSKAISAAISVVLAHAIGSVIIKTVGLAQYYSMPFEALMLWRLLNYLIVGVLEAVILIPLLKSRGLSRQISSIKSTAERTAKRQK